MEYLFDKENLYLWLIQYGSIALFCLLAAGIIALPVPDETLMVMAGVLISKQYLNFYPTVIAAYSGTIFGITVSYFLGRIAGKFLLDKYGKWVGLTLAKQNKIHDWFTKFGKWTLLIGYFIPGIRHFTGFSAGMTKLDFDQFALFAYSGAILWASLFLSVGYFFGDYWTVIFEHIEARLDIAFIIVITLIIGSITAKVLIKKKKINLD